MCRNHNFVKRNATARRVDKAQPPRPLNNKEINTMSIFSDMIREMVKEEIAAAIKEQTAHATPDPTIPEPTPAGGEPMVTAPADSTPEPMVTAETNAPEQFNVEQFRGELRKELSNFMKDTLNGQAVTVESIDPEDALKSILGFAE